MDGPTNAFRTLSWCHTTKVNNNHGRHNEHALLEGGKYEGEQVGQGNSRNQSSRELTDGEESDVRVKLASTPSLAASGTYLVKRIAILSAAVFSTGDTGPRLTVRPLVAQLTCNNSPHRLLTYTFYFYFSAVED